MKYDVKDLGLAKSGQDRIDWAQQTMPVLEQIRERFKKQKPLKGIRLAACLHVTTETGNLATVLRDGGADVVVIASNPLSTQDDVAAALVKNAKIPVFAIKGESTKKYYDHIKAAIDHKPHITMDDGADLVGELHKMPAAKTDFVIGGTEETTTGVIRLKAMEADGALRFAVLAVNDSKTKHLFDNRYGTGQSTVDGMIRATNRLLAGSTFVVCGYGWCSRGVASRAHGMGANVIVTEVDHMKALEAVMDGFRVMPIAEAARLGDFFCSITGDINVIREEHFKYMKDGAVVANSGHFNVELDIPGLARLSKSKREARPGVTEYTLKNGRRVHLLADGRLVNLACAEGHPASVMDMSFANQALAAEYMTKNAGKLEPKVIKLPDAIDYNIAALKLKALGVKIDKLTKEQEKYLASWEHGTV